MDSSSKYYKRLLIGIPAMAIFLTLVTLRGYSSPLLTEEGISPVHSAEFVRTQSRNSSTEADAAFYNPAGLAFLQNGGIYISVNSQNTYKLKQSSIGMWGYQGIDTINNLNTPMASRYQSPSMYLSTAAVAMPSDISFIFKKDNWSVFAAISTLYGQPGATYTQGASLLDRMLIAYNTVLASLRFQQLVNVYSKSYLKRKEVHIGATVGGTYAITDWVSSALAIRYINIQANTKISQTPYAVLLTDGASVNNFQFPTSINTDVSGHGMGIIVGFDFKPLEQLNVSMRLEYYPPMILNKRTNKFITNPVMAQSGQLNIFSDGMAPLIANDRINPGGLGNIFNILTMDPATKKNISNKYKATYPPSISAGFSYRIIPSVKIDTSVDITFPRARDLDGREHDWKFVGYRVGQSIEWNIAKWVVISAGYSYHDFGIRSEKLTDYDDLLPSHTVGAGCTLKPLEFLDITAGGSYSYYISSQTRNFGVLMTSVLGNQIAYNQQWNQKLSRNDWSVSLGVTFSVYPIAAYRRKKAEEHYWKGMSSFLTNDIDSAIDQFKSARSNNPYYKDVDKKIKELTELQKIMKKNIEQEKEEKARNKNEKKESDVNDEK